MNEQNMERKFGNKNSRIVSGLFLVVVGGLLLLYEMGAPIPGWIFTWPVLLIAIGLLISLKSGLRNPGGFIMILIGTIFLSISKYPAFNFIIMFCQ